MTIKLDWESPPKNAQENLEWFWYLQVWEPNSLPDPAIWVLRWLRVHGTPEKLQEERWVEDEFITSYGRALNVFIRFQRHIGS